jgi:hypothetical protein
MLGSYLGNIFHYFAFSFQTNRGHLFSKQKIRFTNIFIAKRFYFKGERPEKGKHWDIVAGPSASFVLYVAAYDRKRKQALFYREELSTRNCIQCYFSHREKIADIPLDVPHFIQQKLNSYLSH